MAGSGFHLLVLLYELKLGLLTAQDLSMVVLMFLRLGIRPVTVSCFCWGFHNQIESKLPWLGKLGFGNNSIWGVHISSALIGARKVYLLFLMLEEKPSRAPCMAVHSSWELAWILCFDSPFAVHGGRGQWEAKQGRRMALLSQLPESDNVPDTEKQWLPVPCTQESKESYSVRYWSISWYWKVWLGMLGYRLIAVFPCTSLPESKWLLVLGQVQFVRSELSAEKWQRLGEPF